MTIFNDSQIAALIIEGKKIPDGLRPLSRQVERNQHRRRDYEVRGASGSDFLVAVRQSILNPFDFSVILGYKVPGFNTVFRLRRYNGKSHVHTNTIERETIRGFHMHLATERYQRSAGSKEDGFAQETSRYWNLESAIDCLIEDCGFVSPMGESPLFTGTPYEN
jgi:hypothetical protein